MLLKTYMRTCLLIVFIFGLGTSYFARAENDLLLNLESDFRSSREASQKIAEVATQLELRGDRRAQFAHIYSITIRATAEEIHKGRFNNPRWVEKLVVNYANLYRETLRLELAGERAKLPLAWQRGFRLAETDRWNANFDLIYGIKVHISRDLVEALYVTPTHFDDPTVKSDFYFISEILGSAMPEIWQVYLRFGRMLPAISLFTEHGISDWISRLRDQAWVDAYSTRGFSLSQKEVFLDRLDQRSADDSRNFGLLLLLF